MTFRRQPSGSYFGPRPRMSTRLKVASGLSLRKPIGRFRSPHLMKIQKQCKADMMFMKQCKGKYNVNDQQVNVVSWQAQKNPPKGSNVGPSSDLAVNKDKSNHSRVSNHAGQPPPSRTEKGANPCSKEFKYSKASSIRNALPLKKLEKPTPLKSKGHSNITSRHVDQFHILDKDVHNIGSLAQTQRKPRALASAHRSAKNANSSDLNNDTRDRKTNEATNSSSMLDGDQDVRGLKRKSSDDSTPLFGKSRPQKDGTLSESEASLKLRNGVRPRSLGSDGKTNDDMSKSKEALSGAKDNSSDEDHVGDEHRRGFIQRGKLTCMPTLRRKRDIEAHVDQVGSKLEVAFSKACVEQQCYCCSKPIDEPIWSPGTFKMDGKEYTSLAGHLSTKSGKKVWALSSSLPAVLEVTKESISTAWPKIWKASKPTGDSVGLYFLPHKMRHDEELDQLIREVMNNDLVLRADIGEAELLILPSVILPERYQTFQNKYYLWGAFKPKEDKCVITGQQNDKGRYTQEEEKEKHVSSQLDEVQSEEADEDEPSLMKSAMPAENQQLPGNSIQETKACCAQGPTKMGLELEGSEERGARNASPQAVFPSAATVLATDATTIPAPAEATAVATDATSLPENHGLTDLSMGASPGSSSVFSIVVRETPRLKQFIQEMDQVGALIAVVQGEAISASPWLSNMTTTKRQQ